MNNKIEQILQQIKELFLNLKFKEINIGNRVNYVFDNIYCIPQYIDSLGFFIEYADTLENAQNNWHEDGESFPIDIGETAIIDGIKKELRKYVIRFDKKIFQTA